MTFKKILIANRGEISCRAIKATRRVGVAVSAGLLASQPAAACTVIWDAARAGSNSDAVVWGAYVPGDARGLGKIEVSRREKGRREREMTIRWDADWVDDGVDCSPWRPMDGYPRGRFFLKDNGDGTFSVYGQDPVKKAKK